MASALARPFAWQLGVQGPQTLCWIQTDSMTAATAMRLKYPGWLQD